MVIRVNIITTHCIRVCVYATVIIKEKEEQTNENRRIISNIAQIGFKAVHSMSTEFSQHRKYAYHSFH